MPHSSYWTMLPSTICSGANGQEPYNHGGAATSVVVGSSNGFMVRIEIGQNGLMELVNGLKWSQMGTNGLKWPQIASNGLK